jgi:hypothetical protein
MLRPGPLDFPGSCWNGTTAVFSDWFIQHVLQSGFDSSPHAADSGTSPRSPAVALPQALATSTSEQSFPGWILQSTVGAGTPSFQNELK